MKDKMKMYASEAIRLAIELNADDFHVWCDFSGHVDTVYVRASAGGWVKDKDDTFRDSFNTAFDESNKAQIVLEGLVKHHEDFRKGQSSGTV